MSQSPPPDRFTERVSLRPSAQAPPFIGERVHNYEVVSKIGEGGMGAVYMASHQFFERKAALKVLHPRLSADENSVLRFMNEARAANAIRHPNIIEVVDTGFLPRSGAPYLLTEYLEGESLAARLKRLGRLPFDTALQIAGQTASALAAAHDQGIVHRDLKPENLFLVPRPGSADLVKVLDFGIAKLRAELSGPQAHTDPGTVVGTPRYMSPEQCRGGSWPIDHRTDIYSLGVILYEMLAGVRPFESDGAGELMTMHLAQQPARLRAHVPDVPAYIESAVMCALNKQPGDRFPSMRDLRVALGSAAIPRVLPPGMTADPSGGIGGGGGGGGSGTTTARGWPAGRRRRMGAIAGAVVALGAAVVGVALWTGRPGPAGTAGAPPPAQAAGGQPPPQEVPAAAPGGSPTPPTLAPTAAVRPAPSAPLTGREVWRPASRAAAQKPPLARRRFPGRKAEPARPEAQGPESASPPAPPPPADKPVAAPKKFVPPLW